LNTISISSLYIKNTYFIFLILYIFITWSNNLKILFHKEFVLQDKHRPKIIRQGKFIWYTHEVTHTLAIAHYSRPGNSSTCPKAILFGHIEFSLSLFFSIFGQDLFNYFLESQLKTSYLWFMKGLQKEKSTFH